MLLSRHVSPRGLRLFPQHLSWGPVGPPMPRSPSQARPTAASRKPQEATRTSREANSSKPSTQPRVKSRSAPKQEGRTASFSQAHQATECFPAPQPHGQPRVPSCGPPHPLPLGWTLRDPRAPLLSRFLEATGAPWKSLKSRSRPRCGLPTQGDRVPGCGEEVSPGRHAPQPAPLTFGI